MSPDSASGSKCGGCPYQSKAALTEGRIASVILKLVVLEARAVRLTLGVEKVQRVLVAVAQTQPVHVDVLLGRQVRAGEVDHELAVDEDPDVIVPLVFEHLTGRPIVDERALDLGREVVVVVGVGRRIPEELAVDREVPVGEVVLVVYL